MNVYVFQAAFLCENCATQVVVDHGQDCDDTSDCRPQGPYSDGGGEADCPQHCDYCNVFLENPLTRDGYKYVLDAMAAEADAKMYSRTVAEWQNFYIMEE